MEFLKREMVNHLLRRSSVHNLERDCQKIAAETVAGLSTSMSLISSARIKICTDCGSKNVQNQHINGAFCLPTEVTMTCHVSTKSDQKCSEKKPTQRKLKQNKLFSHPQEEFSKKNTPAGELKLRGANISLALLQNELENLNITYVSVQDRLNNVHEFLKSLKVDPQDVHIAAIEDELKNVISTLKILENELINMDNSRNQLQQELQKAIVSRDSLLQELVSPKKKISSNYSDVDLILSKQQLLFQNNKILCTSFEISQSVSKKCTCKKKDKCKPYFHEKILEDSIFYTFIEKDNTSKNIRLAKIMEQLEVILRRKNSHAFEFAIDNNMYDIEFVWIQNNIIYLIQADIYRENGSKNLFNKRWIKITV